VPIVARGATKGPIKERLEELSKTFDTGYRYYQEHKEELNTDDSITPDMRKLLKPFEDRYQIEHPPAKP
jgi:hypothetical protein